MALIQKRLKDKEVLVISENLTESFLLRPLVTLSNKEEEAFNRISNESRKREFLKQRYLIQQHISALPKLVHNSDGKPSLSNGSRISITHSHGQMALMVHPEKEVGIDLQVISKKLLKIAKRFMHESELEQWNAGSLRSLHIYWCAKEALYKYASKPGISFKNEMRVRVFGEGISSAEFVNRKGQWEQVNLEVLHLSNSVLVKTLSL